MDNIWFPRCGCDQVHTFLSRERCTSNVKLLIVSKEAAIHIEFLCNRCHDPYPVEISWETWSECTKVGSGKIFGSLSWLERFIEIPSAEKVNNWCFEGCWEKRGEQVRILSGKEAAGSELNIRISGEMREGIGEFLTATREWHPTFQDIIEAIRK